LLLIDEIRGVSGCCIYGYWNFLQILACLQCSRKEILLSPHRHLHGSNDSTVMDISDPNPHCNLNSKRSVRVRCMQKIYLYGSLLTINL
jgi:hypothetical protein